MTWQEELDKQYKIVKGGEQNAVSASGNNVSGISGVRGISDTAKKRNSVIIKGENAMITVAGALSDLDQYIQEADDINAKAILKGFKTLVKFLSTMRSNQLLTDVDKVRIQKEKETRKEKE